MGLTQGQIDKLLPQWSEAASRAEEAAKERLVRGAQSGNQQRAEADARLAQLFKQNEIEQDRIEQNYTAAEQDAINKGLDPKKVKISAGVNFRSVDPENEGLMQLLGLQARMQEQDEKKVAQFSDRITKSNVPRQVANMRAIEQSTASVDKDGNPVGGILTNPNYKVKSVGPLANMIPDAVKPMALNIGESLGMVDKGAANEARAIQQIINVDTKEMSGVAVTAFENARNRLAQGLAAGASPELIRQYTQEAHRAMQDIAQNIESGYSPRIRGMYQQFGGALPSQELQMQPQMSDRQKRIQEIKARLGKQ